MAPFKDGRDDGRIDFGILRLGGVFVYYEPEYMEGILDWFRRNDYRICEADCSAWISEATAWAGLSRALGFSQLPYTVDVLNPDMLDDELEDIEIPEESGTLLVLQRIELFVRSLPAGSHRALDSLALASRYHSLFGRRFMTIALCNDGRLKFGQPLGGIKPHEER